MVVRGGQLDGPTVFLDEKTREFLAISEERLTYRSFLKMLTGVRAAWVSTYSISSGGFDDDLLGRIWGNSSIEDGSLRMIVDSPDKLDRIFTDRICRLRGWSDAENNERLANMIRCPEDSQSPVLHAKILILTLADDMKIAVVGSSNATHSGLSSNWELNVALGIGKEDNYGIVHAFEEIWNRCTPIDPALLEEKQDLESPIDPFSWQQKMVDQLSKKWTSVARGGFSFADKLEGYTISMPPGTGKTVVAAELINKIMDSYHLRVLWLAHRDILLRQAAATLRRQTKGVRKIHRVSANLDPIDIDMPSILLGTDAGLYQNLRKVSRIPFDIIVVDEVHRYGAKRYSKIFKDIRTKFIIGLSATPARLGVGKEKTEFLERFPNDSEHRLYLSPKEAFSLRHENKFILAEVNHIEIDTGWTMIISEDDPWKMANEERNQINIFAMYFTPVIVETYIALVKRKVERFGHLGPTLIFASGIDHAELLKDKISTYWDGRSDEVWIGAIHSGMNRGEQLAVLSEFKKRGSSAHKILIGVDIVAEGFDIPELRTVLLARPTTSLRLYTQMIGRGLRGPAIKGTSECNFVHFGAQVSIAGEIKPGMLQDLRGVLNVDTPRVRELDGRYIAGSDTLLRTIEIAKKKLERRDSEGKKHIKKQSKGSRKEKSTPRRKRRKKPARKKRRTRSGDRICKCKGCPKCTSPYKYCTRRVRVKGKHKCSICRG